MTLGGGNKLPPGWEQGTANGQTYYVNHVTKQTQWEVSGARRCAGVERYQAKERELAECSRLSLGHDSERGLVLDIFSGSFLCVPTTGRIFPARPTTLVVCILYGMKTAVVVGYNNQAHIFVLALRATLTVFRLTVSGPRPSLLRTRFINSFRRMFSDRCQMFALPRL